MRTTAVFAATTAMALVLILAGTGLLLVLRSSLLDNAQSLALTQMNSVVRQIQEDDSRAVPSNIGGSSTQITQVISAAGVVLVSSDPSLPSLYEGPPLKVGESYLSESRGITSLVDFDDYTVAAQAVQGRAETLTVVVSVPTTLEKGAVLTVGWSLLIGIPLILGLTALLIWVLVGRALRPVEAIRTTVAGITHHQLDQRVDVVPTHDEVERLALTMNEMLQRLQTGDEVQRRFVADASHELRSPLATLRTGLEVAIADPSGQAWAQSAQMLAKQTQRMSYLVEDLMTLAKIDDAGLRFTMEDVDLDDVLAEEVARLKTVSNHRVSLALEPLRISGDANRLAQVFRNVLNNADRHAATYVSITAEMTTATATVIIENDGDTIPEDDRERIFERFIRLDESRSRETGGSGLGLAISRDILKSHSGTITTGRSQHGNTIFTINIPQQIPPTNPFDPSAATG
ncbi:ATP-binding protein [Pseudarthrobacter sp. PS3-L1]|uniref:sensor histidine kinase n=1 Tax=Pseudarthrobacter sp. PS3-L1 TaxID=3046207 RepID=UPI0024BBA4BA|nr:ATP-binding protein [Pseudarthrobacter sp. PS3-L1]MDJ0319941.1 ATP-binding protein [Pseudarthrobacter sp. PS3-L1]